MDVRPSDNVAPRAKYAIVLKEARTATEADTARVEAEQLFEAGMQHLYKQTKNRDAKRWKNSNSRSRSGKPRKRSRRKHVLII